MSKFKGGNVMAKLEDTISRFFGGNDGIFGNRLLIIVVLVFLVLCTDILDNFFEDDSMWIWVILIWRKDDGDKKICGFWCGGMGEEKRDGQIWVAICILKGSVLFWGMI